MKRLYLYRITRPIISLFVKCVFRPKIVGIENIPNNSKFVLAGNHTNNLDCILLISCTKNTIHFLAKDSLMKGLKGIIFKNMGIIPVNRKIHDKGALNNAINALNNNQTIGIFPEGTINRTDDVILPFKFGAVKMAYETKSEIIPFVITGKYKLFKNNLKIEFLKPITIGEDLTEENNKLMKLISDKLKDGE